jgi:hypothetical protein
MNKHLDPAHNVYVNLDKIDKAELYNDYALLVEKYRALRAHANDLLDVIDSECDREAICDEHLDDVVAYETFRNDPDNYTTASPSIYCVIIGEDGCALRGEDK